MVANQLVYEAVETDETYQLMLQRLQELSVELKKKKEVDPGVSVVNSCTVGDSSAPPLDDPSQVLLQNPNISQTKGRKKPRNCPENPNRKKFPIVDEDEEDEDEDENDAKMIEIV
ncbi:hypothetical protein IFM89_034397 [Coptis chinensis]|uniref:Uncharacterized protein n=1 Tax=Coptis chinensis TaxID=261450 RepID=A0A835IZP2_9MAGN|nr:hypothetical protein IFM89_034397 [Coptis chinensis]